MIPAQVAFQEEPKPTDGLRSRKKLKTRLAIRDAALELFAERGYEATTVDEIAAQAEVSTTTFFAYYRSKSEVIIGGHEPQVAALRQAIIDRPASENDLVAVRTAMRDAWAPTIDPHRTALFAKAVKTSPILRGLLYDLSLAWAAAITDALAGRRGLDTPDQACTLAARITLHVVYHGLESWMHAGCRTDLGAAIDESYDVLAHLHTEWFA